MQLNRRNLLKALGLAGSAYFVPSLGRRKAYAADATIPTRILFFYTPHGTMFRQWVQPPAGATAATETNFDLGPILQPLAAFKSKMTILAGLGMDSTGVDPTAGTNGHIGGQTHALSAINRANPSASGGISIDQFIANGINSLSPVTALPSLELSARGNAGIAAFLTSWAGSNSLVPPMTSPATVYSRLFPNGPPSSQGPDPAAAALANRRKSILDGVLGEFNAVKQPLSAADKAKLDSHASMIRDLEARLGFAPTVGCSAPPQTIAAPYKADCPYGAGMSCVQDAVTAFTSLAVSAFSCDIARVITFDVDQLPSTMFGVPDIHAFLHSMDDMSWYMKGTISATSAAQVPANILIANKFYASYATFLANLLTQLNAVSEPDGSTLLDHTIVVWCGEIGSSNHSNNLVNYLLVGGGGGFLKTGRYLTFPVQKNGFGPPHNNLFVSLANGMGLKNVTTFGNPSICTGPMTVLQG